MWGQTAALTGDAKYYCDPCASLQDGSMFSRIWRLPPVLVLQINRVNLKGGICDTAVDFPACLDLSDLSRVWEFTGAEEEEGEEEEEEDHCLLS